MVLEKLFINGLILFAYESRINIAWPPAIRNIASYITEGASLFAGRTSLRHGIGPKCVTAV